MKIIVVGCGKAGREVATQLSKEGHEVTVTDRNGNKVRTLTDRIDVLGVEGNGVSSETLIEAGAKNADILIATTDSDEHNLLCCLFAKKFGTAHTIARIRDPEFFDEIPHIREDLNLSMVINPELYAAREIARLLKFPEALKIDTFARGRVDIINFKLPNDSPLSGVKVFEITSRIKGNVLLCAVKRSDEEGGTCIPGGNFELKGGDNVWFVASSHKQAISFIKAAGVSVLDSIKSVAFIGGGKITYYTASILDEAGIKVKIIESDLERCQYLSRELPNAIIINGDGTDQQLILEEGIADADAVCAMTGIDEENIMFSLYVSSISKAKLVTKIDRVSFRDVINTMNVGSIVNPQNITADAIVSYVRAMSNSTGSNVKSMCKIADDTAEALEFRVIGTKSYTGIPLKDLKFKDNTLIAAINRNSKILTPNGHSTIEPDDTVIVVTTRKGLDDLEDILA